MYKKQCMRWGLRHISTVFLFLPNMKVKNRMYFFLISYSFIVISGGTVYNRISKNRMRSFSKDLFFLEKGASAERRKDHDKYNIKG